MNIEAYKATIVNQMNPEREPHILDKLDQAHASTCLGRAEQVLNKVLFSMGQPVLPKEDIEKLERAWVFSVTLDDGDYQFIATDIGNTALYYLSDVDYQDIKEKIA